MKKSNKFNGTLVHAYELPMLAFNSPEGFELKFSSGMVRIPRKAFGQADLRLMKLPMV
jgi:hypothetical protein